MRGVITILYSSIVAYDHDYTHTCSLFCAVHWSLQLAIYAISRFHAHFCNGSGSKYKLKVIDHVGGVFQVRLILLPRPLYAFDIKISMHLDSRTKSF